jgi:hypothetical protein
MQESKESLHGEVWSVAMHKTNCINGLGEQSNVVAPMRISLQGVGGRCNAMK